MTHLAPIAATLLLTAIVQSALLALCVALVLRLLPALTAAVRSALWIATFLLMAILPFTTLLHTTSTQPIVEPTHLAPIFAIALATLWAAAAAWQLVRLIRGWLQLHQIARAATPITPIPAIAELLNHRRLGTRTPIQLCLSTHVQIPSVAGFLRPRILLPAGLPQTLSTDDLRQIVLHEMQHLHRHDDWTNLLQKLGLALFPLNPALWYVDRRLCQERELACDDGVLRANGASSIAYATCLTNLAQQRMQQATRQGIVARSLALALGAFRRPSELARRIHRILTPGPSATPTARFTATALTAAALLVSAATLTHTPRLVSFEPAPATFATAEPTTHFDRTTAHAVLTKATFPITPAPHRIVVKRVHPRAHTIVRRSNLAAPQVILLGWHPNEFSVPPFTATRPILIDYRYAAVATPNGWLLIEI